MKVGFLEFRVSLLLPVAFGWVGKKPIIGAVRTFRVGVPPPTIVPPLFDVTSYIRGVPPCIFLRASRLVFWFWRIWLCSALLCFALLCFALLCFALLCFAGVVSFAGRVFRRRMAAMPWRHLSCLLPLSFSAHLSRFRVLRSERSTRAPAAQSRFSAISRRFSSSDKSCSRGFSGNHGSFAEKHSGFGLGVWSERRLFPFRGW